MNREEANGSKNKMIKKELKIELDDNQKKHIGNALIFMCRYSFNRKTSADMATVSAMKALWDFVPNTHKNIILDEIKSEVDLVNNDNFLWREFLDEKERQK